jgi:hypothetical protein
MKLTPQEAQQSLADIEAVMRQTRRSMAYSGAPYYLMLWGAIWFLGNLAGQFLSGSQVGIVWLVLDSLGIVGSVWIGYRLGRRIRTSMGPRVGLFWLALLVYGVVIVWIAQPATSNQFNLLVSLLAMLGYVTTGLWIGGRLVALGIAVSVLALIGYTALPAYFSLWMAVVGGGGIFASGLYILRTWR